MELRPGYPIATQRLVIRPFTAGDVDEILVYRSRADVCRYLPFEPQSREALIRRMADPAMTRTDFTDEGQSLTLGVRSAATGDLLGDVILFFRSREHRGGEIGWVFDPVVAGQGYATEAARAILRLAFEELGLRRVIAQLDARNDASARLCRRLGMRQEAHLVQNELFKGEWSDLLIFALLADEWRTAGESAAG